MVRKIKVVSDCSLGNTLVRLPLPEKVGDVLLIESKGIGLTIVRGVEQFDNSGLGGVVITDGLTCPFTVNNRKEWGIQ